jgi:hypothetical protein
MADENKIPVVIRTQVYLNDPDYFCNKSWTMSYNVNTKTWISYHSYIPNFYIGENNFFYSGLNGCCDDNNSAGFQAIAGVLDKGEQTTTSSTTLYPPPPTTTSTTTLLDCILVGTVITTSCELDGVAIITVPTIPTTTICYRPSNLQPFVLIQGYNLTSDPGNIIFTGSSKEACDSITAIDYVLSSSNVDGSTINKFTAWINNLSDTLEIGNIVYDNDIPYCTFVPDGWYISQDSFPIEYTYHITGGIITSIVNCDCGTTTTTTTAVPDILECCGILLSANDNISYLDKITGFVSQLTVPGYVSSSAIAMTTNNFWSIDTDIKQWDINLSPFSASFNGTIALPMGFVSGYGLVAKNNSILIGIDTSVSPQDIVQLDITGVTAISTIMFSLQTDRVSAGNMLYTTYGKFIIINQNSITSDYYITQYDYMTGAVEIDLNIGSVIATSLFECNCDIFVIDTSGYLYTIVRVEPYVLLNLGINIGLLFVNSATQIASCVTSSMNETTTTTTTAP